MLHEGMIFASDTRTHAGVNAFAKFCKMTVFERRGNRVIVLLSSGNLASVDAHPTTPEALECLAALASYAESHREPARLFAAAHTMRQRTGIVRYKVYDADYDASIAAVRATVGDNEFESTWAEGSALPTDEAIAYAQRGRGERKRPTSGWASLTPAERDVVRLVSEGLGNKDIGTRLFISPRTVQTHLTHVYTKLGLTSRVQLVQEAAHHA